MNLDLLFNSFLNEDLSLKHHSPITTPLSIAQAALPTSLLL
jgi:hypothetical protein